MRSTSRSTFTRRATRGLAVALLPAALSAATGLLAAPASAGLGDVAVPVDCTDGATISRDDLTYELHGPCGDVLVTASNVTVRMPAATKLVVRGDHDVVHAKPVQRLLVRGHDQLVDVRSARTARVASPGSRVHFDGLVETLKLPGNRAHVDADQISTLLVGGNRNVVAATRGFDARVSGNHNRAAWRWLDQLRVPGDRNHLDVRRGSTAASVSGTANDVDLNRAG